MTDRPKPKAVQPIDPSKITIALSIPREIHEKLRIAYQLELEELGPKIMGESGTPDLDTYMGKCLEHFAEEVISVLGA